MLSHSVSHVLKYATHARKNARNMLNMEWIIAENVQKLAENALTNAGQWKV
jgi:hypothetical protein